jgi:hypothetical protein
MPMTVVSCFEIGTGWLGQARDVMQPAGLQAEMGEGCECEEFDQAVVQEGEGLACRVVLGQVQGSALALEGGRAQQMSQTMSCQEGGWARWKTWGMEKDARPKELCQFPRPR